MIREIITSMLSALVEHWLIIIVAMSLLFLKGYLDEDSRL